MRRRRRGRERAPGAPDVTPASPPGEPHSARRVRIPAGGPWRHRRLQDLLGPGFIVDTHGPAEFVVMADASPATVSTVLAEGPGIHVVAQPKSTSAARELPALLDAGAEYVIPDLSVEELAARIHALARRSSWISP
ncbi:MAG TPA: hypothetical protein VNE21_08720 [Mycobacteriales bacterium]|nr:hypothetical protein [Mycobacteriales bacterium]